MSNPGCPAGASFLLRLTEQVLERGAKHTFSYAFQFLAAGLSFFKEKR